MQKIVAPSLALSAQNNSSDTIFYNIVGNFVPPEWRGLTSHTGKALSKTAIQILSLLVSRTPTEAEKAASLERNGISTPNELQETYYYFEKLLGLCQRRIRQCMVELEKSGYIKLTLINMTKQYIKYRNIICISLTKNFAPYPQKFSAENEKVFGCTRNNFHPHNIIDNNISMNKSRYRESNFEKTFFKDNFFEKDAHEELEENSNAASNGSNKAENKNKADDTYPLLPFKKLGENGWLSKAKRWCKGKTLAEFHPLTEEDARMLRVKSNRDFNLNFINKLLLRLAEKNSNNRFYSKNAMLNYMTKALTFEMRQASLVNNEGFNFAMAHDIKQREEFLSKIENSTDTSLQAQLEKKIAGIFRPDIACSLLKSCRLANHVSEVYKLKLTREIELSKNMQETLLKQIKAVYGNNVKSLKIVAYSNQKLTEQKNESAINNQETEQQYLKAQGLNDDTTWSKVKRYLLEKYGVHLYRSWFSNLTVVEENNETNQIILKPTTNFIGDWISSKYGQDLQMAFRNLNFSYEILRLKPQEI